MKIYKITILILITALLTVGINGYIHYQNDLWTEKTIEDWILAITDAGYDQETHSNYVIIKWGSPRPDAEFFGINNTDYFIDRYRNEDVHLEYIENNNEVKYLKNIRYWEDPDAIDYLKMPVYNMTGKIIDVYKDYLYYGEYVSQRYLHTIVVLDNVTEGTPDDFKTIEIDNYTITNIEVRYTQTLLLESSDYEDVKEHMDHTVTIYFKDAFLGFGYQLYKIEVRT